MKTKTIFIVISRGFIIRNILRSGVLDILVDHGMEVVLLFANVRGKEFPNEIRTEFSGRVTIEVLPSDTMGNNFKERLYRKFTQLVSFLVYSPSTWIYSKSGTQRQLQRSKFLPYIQRLIYTPLSKISVLKKLARWIEDHIFYDGTYAHLFDTYRPMVVFSTSIVSKHDIECMKEAKRRGIKTVSMCKGWDNITKILLRTLPDLMIVQNEGLKNDMERVQNFPRNHIAVTGFPQFDWYKRTEIIIPRAEFFAQLGLPADRRLLFFGSEGAWAPDDDRIAETLAQWVNGSETLVRPCSLLVRPHFSDITNPRFNRFRGIPNVKLDDNYSFSDFFIDNWNPGVAETKFFVNCIYHSDMMIMVASTLALDAACLDKPVIGIGYNVLHRPNGEDVSRDLYETDHYRAVVQTQAITMVYSDSELKSAVNNYLTNPTHNQAEREVLRKELCFRVDGNSSKRMAHNIMSLVK